MVPISSAIVQLQEAGRLHVLKDRWWKQRRGGGKCDVSRTIISLLPASTASTIFLDLFFSSQATNKKSSANELTLDSVGGVFVVLLAGMGLACATSVLEYVWNRKNRKNKAKDSSIVVKGLASSKSNSLKMTGRQHNCLKGGGVRV